MSDGEKDFLGTNCDGQNQCDRLWQPYLVRYVLKWENRFCVSW